MKHLLLAAAASLSLSAGGWAAPAPGAWPVEIPVEGVTAENAGGLRSLLRKRFEKMKRPEDDFSVERVDEIHDGVVRLIMGCQTGIHLDRMRAALAESEFSLQPDSWELYGKATLTWRTPAILPEERLKELEKALGAWGTFEINRLALPTKVETFEYRMRILFDGREKTFAWLGMQETLRKLGLEGIGLGWDNLPIGDRGSRIDCGARRVKDDPKGKS